MYLLPHALNFTRPIAAPGIATINNLPKDRLMKFLLWLLLLFLCWPLALLALVLYPIVWLISLPLRLLDIAVEGVFALLAAMVMLPARLLRGHA